MVWVRSAGGPSVDRATAIAVDAAQNVYHHRLLHDLGGVQEPAVERRRVGDAPERQHHGRPDRHEWFVARLLTNGDWSWARQIGGPGHDEGLRHRDRAGGRGPEQPDGRRRHRGRSHRAVRTSTRPTARPPPSAAGSPAASRPASQCGWTPRATGSGRLEAGQAGASEWLTGVAVDANGRVYVSGVYLEATSIATPSPTALPFTGVAGRRDARVLAQVRLRGRGDLLGRRRARVLDRRGELVRHPLRRRATTTRSTSAGNTGALRRRRLQRHHRQQRQPDRSPAERLVPVRTGPIQRSPSTSPTSPARACASAGAWAPDAYVGAVGWKIDDVVDQRRHRRTSSSRTTSRAGPAKWAVSSPHGGVALVDHERRPAPRRELLVRAPIRRRSPTTGWRCSTRWRCRTASPRYFIAKIGGTEVNTPFWQWATPMGPKVSVGGIAIDATPASSSSPAPRRTPRRLVRRPDARRPTAPSSPACRTTAAASPGAGCAARPAARARPWRSPRTATPTCSANTLRARPTFDPVQDDPPEDDASATEPVTLPASAGARDLFVARLAAAGSKWRWVQTAHPAAPAARRPPRSAAGTNDQLYVVGDFDDTTASARSRSLTQGGNDVFVANLERHDRRVVRGAISSAGRSAPRSCRHLARPASPTRSPECRTSSSRAAGRRFPDYFYWSAPGATLPADDLGHLYAVQPVAAEIKWKVSCDAHRPRRASSGPGAADWPRRSDTGRALLLRRQRRRAAVGGSRPCIQPHIAGAPVDIEPAGSGVAYSSMVALLGRRPQHRRGGGRSAASSSRASPPPSPATASCSIPGVPPSRDLQNASADHPDRPHRSPTTPASQVGGDSRSSPTPCTCEIGEEIIEPTHEEYGGKNGHVIFERAYFDGDGRRPRLRPQHPARADRAGQPGAGRLERPGPAWPSPGTGRTPATSPGRSSRNATTAGGRPTRTRSSSPASSAPRCSGSRRSIRWSSPACGIYNQPDRAKPGFNPNDEHAIFAPANSSSGFNAVFALRSDHTETERNKTSKPYALLKYIRTDNGKWAYRVYQVVATGARLQDLPVLRHGGQRRSFAPYPVRLLGNCPQNEATGKPAFKDYKNQVWAKSAGTLVAEYWYPLQPTFYYDRDANGIPETATPRLRRLARRNRSTIRWTSPTTSSGRPNAPVLLVGETLLGSKRGLPEIAAQAAVEIVFDEKVQRHGGQPRLRSDQVAGPPDRSAEHRDSSICNAIPAERRDRIWIRRPAS